MSVCHARGQCRDGSKRFKICDAVFIRFLSDDTSIIQGFVAKVRGRGSKGSSRTTASKRVAFLLVDKAGYTL